VIPHQPADSNDRQGYDDDNKYDPKRPTRPPPCSRLLDVVEFVVHAGVDSSLVDDSTRRIADLNRDFGGV
jgi:hypothetical protein